MIPTCPKSTVKLWDGFSLLHIMGNGHPHGQDLGEKEGKPFLISKIPFGNYFGALKLTIAHLSSRDLFTIGFQIFYKALPFLKNKQKLLCPRYIVDFKWYKENMPYVSRKKCLSLVKLTNF